MLWCVERRLLRSKKQTIIDSLAHPLESPRYDEITIESRVIKRFGERGGRPVIFLLRQKYFLRAVEFVLGDKIFGRNL